MTQFRRIIAGQAVLTPYRFSYTRNFENVNTPSLRLDFDISPESTPPTNVHVLIGANGVGKSMLLRDFVKAARGLTSALGLFSYHTTTLLSNSVSESFVNIVHISY